MPVMTIGTNNLQEEMAAIKTMLERLVKENEEKEAHIKLHEENIARLIRKLEKRSARSLAKGSASEEEERAFVQSEATDEQVHSKKGSKLKDGEFSSLLTVEQIQDLITNIVKVQLRVGTHKNSPLHQALQ